MLQVHRENYCLSPVQSVVLNGKLTNVFCCVTYNLSKISFLKGAFCKTRAIIHLGGGGREYGQGWHSDKSTRLLQILASTPGLSFLLVLSLAPRDFSPVFPSPQKQTFQIPILSDVNVATDDSVSCWLHVCPTQLMNL